MCLELNTPSQVQTFKSVPNITNLKIVSLLIYEILFP